MTPDPTIPDHLSDAGAGFYGAVLEDHGDRLTLAQQAALLQAAETLDLIAALEAGLREHGPVLPDGKVSPLAQEIRQQRAILVRLVGLLDLREEGASGGLMGTSRAASKAASTRWAAKRGSVA